MAENSENQSTPKKGFGLLALLKAVAVITGIVIVEVVAASVLIPTAQDAETTARRLAAAEQGEVDDTGAPVDQKAEASSKPVEESIEVDLGGFNVTRYNPENDTTLIIDFELFGVVLAEQESEFYAQLQKNKVRVREQVIMTLGGADTTDLTDAELGLLKRRILEKTNRALGKPLVQEVLFSKFNFVER